MFARYLAFSQLLQLIVLPVPEHPRPTIITYEPSLPPPQLRHSADYAVCRRCSPDNIRGCFTDCVLRGDPHYIHWDTYKTRVCLPLAAQHLSPSQWESAGHHSYFCPVPLVTLGNTGIFPALLPIFPRSGIIHGCLHGSPTGHYHGPALVTCRCSVLSHFLGEVFLHPVLIYLPHTACSSLLSVHLQKFSDTFEFFFTYLNQLEIQIMDHTVVIATSQGPGCKAL